MQDDNGDAMMKRFKTALSGIFGRWQKEAQSDRSGRRRNYGGRHSAY